MYTGPPIHDDRCMQDTYSDPTTHHTFRRSNGPVGGVLAGLGHKLGIDATLLRVGTAVAAFLLGPFVVLTYLAAWWLVPVDESLPTSQHPGSVPKMLVGIVAAIIAVQIAFGLITSLPLGWMIVAGVAVYWFFIKD